MENPQEYRQKPITVSAAKWEEELGSQFGVRERPKKHKANPTEFYVRNRYGKEILINPGDWVITFKDGSNEVIEGAAFLDMYELVQPEESQAMPEDAPDGPKP